MLAQVLRDLPGEYLKSTPVRAQLCDVYIAFCVLVAVLQYVYMKVAGDFPYNAFLAGFYCCIGVATLTVCLRVQLDSKRVQTEYAEYLWCCLLIFLVSFNYLG